MGKTLGKIYQTRIIGILRHPVIVLCLLLCTILAIGTVVRQAETPAANYTIGIVNQDEGSLGDELVNRLQGHQLLHLQSLPPHDVQRLTASGRIAGAFILPPDFSARIEQGDLDDLITFIHPAIVSGAYPVTEILSAQVVDLWLDALVHQQLSDAYNQMHGHLDGFDTLDLSNSTITDTADIVTIDELSMNALHIPPAPNTAVRGQGIFAAFAFFAIALSTQWVFALWKQGLRERLLLYNIQLPMLCLAAQAATVTVCMLFYIPVAIVSHTLFPGFETYLQALSMLLYLLGVCGLTLAIATWARTLTALILLESAAGVLHLILTPLIIQMPPEWTSSWTQWLPGGRLMRAMDDPAHIPMLILTALLLLGLGLLMGGLRGWKKGA